MGNYYVYFMASQTGVIYIGVTNDLARRVSEHKLKLVEGFTKQYNCIKLVYYEEYSEIKQAIAREKYLKGKNRKFKIDLIENKNHYWKDQTDELFAE